MYDHIGLKISDIDASVRFYESALGALGLELCSRDLSALAVAVRHPGRDIRRAATDQVVRKSRRLRRRAREQHLEQQVRGAIRELIGRLADRREWRPDRARDCGVIESGD